MVTNKDRGTKRTCQNGECSARFYDLNRSPIICPICSSKYLIAHSPLPIAGMAQEEKRKVKKPEFEASSESEAESELADVETDDADEAVDDVADETFLEEEEEDGGDVTGIIGSAVDGEES